MNIRDFFYLQRNDRQALLVVFAIIILSITLVILIGQRNIPQQTKPSTSPTNRPSDATHQAKPINAITEEPLYYKIDGDLNELFVFDPNTADSTQLLRLGLKSWQVRSIYRFRSKGGIYRTPTDFAQLYGLTKKQYETLAPYIHISEDYRPASDFYKRKNRDDRQTHQSQKNDSVKGMGTSKSLYPHKLQQGQTILLNSADTTELQKIPGIGSWYARAIIRYRERLGGFVNAHQLLEITGVPEHTLDYVTINSENIQKMNINKLSISQLSRHPYINFYQAKAICDYRRLKGSIKNLQELKLLKDFPPAELERLLPYVEY